MVIKPNRPKTISHKKILMDAKALFRAAKYGKLFYFMKEIEIDFLKTASIKNTCEFLIQKGRLFHQTCKFLTAEDEFNEVLSILKKQESHEKFKLLKGIVYRVLGDLKSELKHEDAFKEAEKLIQKSIGINCTLPKTDENLNELGKSFGAIGRFYMNESNTGFSFEKAIEYHKKNLEICIDIKSENGIEMSLNQIAMCYNSLGNHKIALKFLDKNFKNTNLRKLSIFYGSVEYAIANLGIGKNKEALKNLKVAENIFTKINQYDYEPYYKIAVIYEKLGDLNAAQRAIKKTIKTVEKARKQSSSPLMRRNYFDAQKKYYRYSRNLHIKLKDYLKAAVYQEMYGNRTLIDLYSIYNSEPSNLKKLKELLSKFDKAEWNYKHCYNYDKRFEYMRKMVTALNDGYLNIEEMISKGKKVVTQNEEKVNKSISIILNKYRDIALVMPLMNNDKPAALIITGKEKDYIEFRIKNIKSVSGYSEKKLASLGEKVIKPILNSVGNCKRITIVPDDNWDGVYFHAGIIDNKYFIQNYFITYHISCFLFSSLIEKKRLKNKKNHVFSQYNQTSRKEISYYKEAESIADKLENCIISAGNNMTRESVLKSFLDSDIVHISAHNKFYGNEQIASILECGNGDVLTPAHIFYSDIVNSKLITLAACETGIMRKEKEREPVGLSSSLLCKGARNIIASFKTIHSQNTNLFFEIFYSCYKNNPITAYHDAVRKSIIDKNMEWKYFFLFSS